MKRSRSDEKIAGIARELSHGKTRPDRDQKTDFRIRAIHARRPKFFQAD